MRKGGRSVNKSLSFISLIIRVRMCMWRRILLILLLLRILMLLVVVHRWSRLTGRCSSCRSRSCRFECRFYVLNLYQLLYWYKGQFTPHWLGHGQLGQSLKVRQRLSVVVVDFLIKLYGPTLACSTAMVAAFSASRCLRSFNLSEKMATDLALFTSFCLSRDFLAANSAAI